MLKTPLLVALLAATAAHHRAKPTPAPAPAPAPDRPAILADGTLHMPDSYCERNADHFLYLGPDGLIGVGLRSCDEAFADWRTTGKLAILPQA
jgi:hypothetical protein